MRTFSESGKRSQENCVLPADKILPQDKSYWSHPVHVFVLSLALFISISFRVLQFIRCASNMSLSFLIKIQNLSKVSTKIGNCIPK